jgi:hypothetical protein
MMAMAKRVLMAKVSAPDILDPPDMMILPSTPRAAKRKLESIAQPKASMENSGSAMDAIITPPMIGRSAPTSMSFGNEPSMMTPIRTEQSGSAAFTTLAKATEPAPSDMTVAKCPPPWKAARVAIWPALKFLGNERPPRPRTQTGRM